MCEDNFVISASDTNIELISSKILGSGFDVGFLVPTETAMIKSIMDAHGSFRAFLKRNEIHDYENQSKGVIRKINAQYISNGEVLIKTISLYRPETKNGDPRIWIYGLKDLAKACNLLAFIYSSQELFIVNCSNSVDLTVALDEIIPKPFLEINNVAEELLGKLRSISDMGFIPNLRSGDTGVGMTLETHLGIEANSSKAPDYKGIEIKAARITQGKKQRSKNQLFSKVPNWKLSPIGSSLELISKRGYIDKSNLRALRHTVDGLKPNSLGLFLDIDYANDYLCQMFKGTSPEEVNPIHDTTWVVSDLKKALLQKHRETFWVKAHHNGDRENEKFHYVEVEHTVNPFVDKLETLIETGLITLDYTLHIKSTGKVRDHGYLFKLKENSMEALFPKPVKHDLTQQV